MSFIIPTKTYEKPEAGQYHGVLADIVDLGIVTTTYNNQTKTQPMIRFIWLLDVLGKDQQKYPDTFGKNLQVQQRFNVTSLHEKSNVYKTLKQILGVPPQPNLDIETLIGQTRMLWITREKSPDGTKDFANIMGILPAQNGYQLVIPSWFIRDKFKPKTVGGQQTYSTPQAAQQATYATATQPPPAFAQAQYVPPVTAPPQYTSAPVAQGADVKF